MRNHVLVASLLLVVGASIAHAAEPPTSEQIAAWWKGSPADKMEIDGPLQEVHLMNEEVAFVAPCSLSGRGRNGMFRAVLIRPQIQEARELPEPAGHDLTVEDIDGDGVSEILSNLVASGQGTTERLHSIFRLDGFTPIVLHAALEEDNLGNCISRCQAVSVAWKFGRQRISGLTSLTETITTRKGSSDDRMASRREIRRYALYGTSFVRADAASLRNADAPKDDSTGQGETNE